MPAYSTLYLSLKGKRGTRVAPASANAPCASTPRRVTLTLRRTSPHVWGNDMAVFLARRGAAALLALAVLSAPVVAEELTFVMNNQHPKPVEVQLYSQNRDLLWPGPRDVFLLDDGETKTM